jgi:mitogen-activated protein kinase kinase 3
MNRKRPSGLAKIKVDGDPPLPMATPGNLDSHTTITIDEKTFEVQADDLEKIADLGRGAYGVVEKMKHIKTGTVMAVKRITATVNTIEQVKKEIAQYR